MARLKVYAWDSFRADKNGRNVQMREIMAASSAAEVRRTSGLTRAEWENSGTDTENEEETTVAMAAPGTIFWTPLEDTYRSVKLEWHRG